MALTLAVELQPAAKLYVHPVSHSDVYPLLSNMYVSPRVFRMHTQHLKNHDGLVLGWREEGGREAERAEVRRMYNQLTLPTIS